MTRQTLERRVRHNDSKRRHEWNVDDDDQPDTKRPCQDGELVRAGGVPSIPNDAGF